MSNTESNMDSTEPALAETPTEANDGNPPEEQQPEDEHDSAVNKSAAQALIAQALALYGGKAKAKAKLLAERKLNDDTTTETSTAQDDSTTSGTTSAPGQPPGNRFRFIKFELRQVNPHIVCRLCAGYFIGATTIMECLHTFCKSCIVKHFATSNKCPTCETTIHETNPLDMLRQDRTIQNVVYKIVKNLQQDELDKEAAFYRDHGITQPSSHTSVRKATTESTDSPPPKSRKIETEYTDDKKIKFKLQLHEKTVLEYSEGKNVKITQLPKAYICTSATATIQSLKKFLASKLSLASPDEVDILCQEQLMGKEHTLQYIKSTWWRGKSEQLSLQYRQKYNIDQI
eukprot:m.13807 g.13807  ORF g.13807 m.13807 type:complete len:344 (+) comp9869_c0_seq1:325-1356(+)